MDLLFKVIIASFFAGVVLTWLVRRAAFALGVLDRPDGVRKLQQAPVPLLGGVGVFGAWVIGLFVGQPPDLNLIGTGVFAGDGFRPTLLMAGIVVMISGVFDDVLTLRPRWKLVGQTIAAAIMVGGGLIVKRVWLFGYTLELGWLGIAFSLIWLVGSMNAVNMLDGLDGLASTVGLVICGTLTWMSCLTGNLSLALISISLAGGLLGFLLFNFAPAQIYLGDSGSMLIGLVIGAVAIQGSFKAPATAALAAPLAVLAIPIFDGLAAVIRRRLSGKAFYTPDRGHIHHCLQRRGWSNHQILIGVGTLCALTGLAVLLGLYFRSEPLALLATGAMIIGCVATKLFGNHEYKLLIGTPRTKWKAIRGGLQIETSRVLNICNRLRDCRTLSEIWMALQQATEEFDLAGLQLAWVNGTLGATLPASDSCFQVTRKQDGHSEDTLWQLSLPLSQAGVNLGVLKVWGCSPFRPILPDLITISMVAEALVAAGRSVLSNYKDNDSRKSEDRKWQEINYPLPNTPPPSIPDLPSSLASPRRKSA
jgi:UDP-GlcNAc:undecaprenyl-phosphate GlcNAc-1-phosphate transferase